jgi:hypothetical protein
MEKISMEVYAQNLALFTRQSAKCIVKDKNIFDQLEIANPSIREGAVLAAKNEETSKYMVANPSVREGAVLAAKTKRPPSIWSPTLPFVREL